MVRFAGRCRRGGCDRVGAPTAIAVQLSALPIINVLRRRRPKQRQTFNSVAIKGNR
jgi:hypothetical protein